MCLSGLNKLCYNCLFCKWILVALARATWQLLPVHNKDFYCLRKRSISAGIAIMLSYTRDYDQSAANTGTRPGRTVTLRDRPLGIHEGTTAAFSLITFPVSRIAVPTSHLVTKHGKIGSESDNTKLAM